MIVPHRTCDDPQGFSQVGGYYSVTTLCFDIFVFLFQLNKLKNSHNAKLETGTLNNSSILAKILVKSDCFGCRLTGAGGRGTKQARATIAEDPRGPVHFSFFLYYAQAHCGSYVCVVRTADRSRWCAQLAHSQWHHDIEEWVSPLQVTFI